MDSPPVTYIVASTMRTGSYLLCEGLEATGVAGHPREVFCPERRDDYAGKWELPPDVGLEDYLSAAVWNGSTDNGVLGIKIHAHHVEPLARACDFVGEPWQVLRQLFPTAIYIHLTRRNRRAQAISWYRAVVTNQWWKIPGVADWDLTGREPEFDGGEIRRMELEIERQEKEWARFFATLAPANAMAMEYELLAADYRGQVARALEFVGQDKDLAKELPEPRLMRQADGKSEQWLRRMDREFPVRGV